MTQKSPSLPPKSKEELDAEAALDAACTDAKDSAKKLDTTTTTLKRTISDSKIKAVRLPTPSQIEFEHK